MPIGGAVIVGDKALAKKLSMLSASHQRKISRPAIRAASAEVRKAAKRLAPRGDTGLLRKSIKNVVRTTHGIVYAVIGPAVGFKQVVNGKNVDPANYGQLVEYGTQAHTISPKGRKGTVGTLRIGQKHLAGEVQHPGAKAKPFLRPAFDQTPSARIIQTRIWKEMDKLAKRK